MNYTKQASFEAAKKNCPIGGTAFSCMPTVEAMRKGRTNHCGYVRTAETADTIYLALNGVELPTNSNPCLVFHK